MRAILLLLFFLSGVSALIYQVVWVRMLGLVFGVTSFAVATVLSSFMAGLALGSYLGGRLVDRRRDPLLIFAGLQVGVGVFALLFPILLSGLTFLYVLIYRQWTTHFYIFSLLRFALAFLLLLIPTTLMGATLPVLSRFFVKKLSRLGSDLGTLYSVNNFGAMLGALLAGFALMELLGVRESAYLAAGISLVIGLVTFYLHRRVGQPPLAEEPAEPATAGKGAGAEAAPTTTGYPRYVYHLVLWVFALEGFTSLGYEVIWARMLFSSTIIVNLYGYALVVATCIAGLALGSFIVRWFVDRWRDLLSVLVWIEIGIGITAVLLLPLFKLSESWIGPLSARFPSWGGWTLATAAWLGALMLVPATLMGMTFPLVSRIYTRSFRELGRRIGKLGCLDTIGSVFGAFAGGFILIPLLGMQKSVLLLAAMNGALGLAVLLGHPTAAWRRKLITVSVVGLLVVAVGVLVPGNVRFVPPDLAREHLLSYDEGVDTTVTVSQSLDGSRILWTNGTSVAGSSRALRTTQITQAHLPVLLYEALNGVPPKRTLAIGLGSGHTSHSLSLHNLETIHCVELVSGVVRAAKTHFRKLNRGVFDDPRYRIFLQDARTYILASDQKYDIILDDSVHPGYPGNAGLYSRDFFAHCRRRLAENGIMSVWVPLFAVPADGMKMIFKSFLDVFPHATLWFATNERNKHMVLIGTPRSLTIDFARFRDRIRRPKIRQDLLEVDLADPFNLLSCLLMDEKALAEYARDGVIHNDNHPYLEFLCARAVRWRQGIPGWTERLIELRNFGRLRGLGIGSLVRGLGKTAREIEENRQRFDRAAQVGDLLTRGFASIALHRYNTAIQDGLAAMKLDPSNPSCRYLLSQARSTQAAVYLSGGLLDSALKLCYQVTRSDPDFAEAHFFLAGAHFRRGELDQAIQAAEEGLKKAPDYLAGRLFLSRFYERKGQVDRARAELHKVLEILPGHRAALFQLQQLDRPRD